MVLFTVLDGRPLVGWGPARQALDTVALSPQGPVAGMGPSQGTLSPEGLGCTPLRPSSLLRSCVLKVHLDFFGSSQPAWRGGFLLELAIYGPSLSPGVMAGWGLPLGVETVVIFWPAFYLSAS